MKNRSDRKIFSIRRPVLFEERAEPRALRARQIAIQFLGGEIASHEAFRRVTDELQLPTMLECSPSRIRFVAPAGEHEELPAGYFYKGGAARQLLGRILSVHAPPPRDIDIVRFGSSWGEADIAVSRKFMPLDFERGFGVEVIAEPGRYLGTRDISVNEVFCGKGEVVASPIAVFDTLGGLLRPCKYRPGSIHRPPSLSSATVVKMLRLRAEGLRDGYLWALIGIPADQVIEPFDVALQLDKAFARSSEVAEVFIEQCRAVGIFSPRDPGANAFLESIGEIVASIYAPERFFRNMPADVLAGALECVR